MSEPDVPTLYMNFAWYNPYNGLEYDWLATDLEGFVACISTGGFGPIPQAVEDAEIDMVTMDERMNRLPEVCAFDPDVRDSYRTRKWLDDAKRGLFVYDWQHSPEHYEMVVRPLRPLLARGLGDRHVQAWAAVITLPIRFSEVSEFTCCTRGRPYF